jgi:hypothetical protein
MTPKNAKHAPTKGEERLLPLTAFGNGFSGIREESKNGLHVVKSDASRSTVQDEDSKPDPIISTDLTLQDDPTRDDSKRKKRSIHMHTTGSERTTKRLKNKQDRPPMSDSEDNSLNDEDRKPAAKNTSPTPDGVPSTCAGLKRKSTSTRTESVVSTRGRGIKLIPVTKIETAPANPDTDQAEASIPTETVIN